ncbi:hypothetical protein GCM10010498_60360 [Streptomyces cavourensis]|nr:hypothetical protein GCM10010498_60360 [Streptomyces cavourensis]
MRPGRTPVTLGLRSRTQRPLPADPDRTASRPRAPRGPTTEDTPMDLPDTPLERTRRTRERAEELGRAADRATDPEHRQRLREKARRLLGEELEGREGN